MSSSPDLVVIGDCNPDVLVLGEDVAPVFGQREKLVDAVSLVVGGSAAITAVAAARLGLSVALVAAVGADPAGQFMLGELARADVDASAVAVRDDMPTGMTVALCPAAAPGQGPGGSDRAGGADRAILTATGAVASLTAADVPAGLLERARHVHVSAYFLMAGSLGPGLAGVLRAARAAGATTSVDTNWDPAGQWGDAHLAGVLAQASLLLPNEAEALRLAGEPDLAAAARALTACGPRLVVKLGPRGALCTDRRGTGGRGHDHVWLPPVPPVDATGAGDCFNAGLIAGLLDGMDLPRAAALGCAAGALSTRAAGGTGSCPDRAEAGALAARAVIEPAAGDCRPAGAGAPAVERHGGA